MINPMKQFFQEVLVPIHIGGVDISITSGVVFMWISMFFVMLFCWGLRKRERQPGRWQMLVEQVVKVLLDMIGGSQCKRTKKVFPVVASLFFIILFGNLLGLIPGSYTFTSQIIVTGFFSTVVFILSIVWGMQKQGLKFLKIFVPKGCSVWLYPLIIPIEIVFRFSHDLLVLAYVFL